MVSQGYVQRATITSLTHLPRDPYAQKATYLALQQIAVGSTKVTKYNLNARRKKHTSHKESSFTHMICTSFTPREQERRVYICKEVLKQNKSTLANDTFQLIGIDALLSASPGHARGKGTYPVVNNRSSTRSFMISRIKHINISTICL